MPTYETYPVSPAHPVNHGVIITQTDAKGTQSVTVLGPYTEDAALAELEAFAHVGTVSIDIGDALVMRVSEREVVVVRDSFFSSWTARAVVASYVSGAA